MSSAPETASAASHAQEVETGERFGFGANWSRFLRHLDDERIRDAEQSLQQMLGLQSLQGLRFLDAGSGSGLFSLAARRLGASVHSFDYDPQSVACTRALRQRYAGEDAQWHVEEGSVLDAQYLASLGSFDIVYSWGVLHHTGQMWTAMDNVSQSVKPGGRLFISIYNDQGGISRYWTGVKRLYNRSALARALLIAVYIPYFIGLRWVYRRFTGGGRIERGMTLWTDMLDWLGGYPFEVAKPEEVFRFLRTRGLTLREMTTAGRTGACNEFVLQRAVQQAEPATPSTSA
jgi:2-polyprenyl-6-hydroxyphenyl methylase/3-demethylubiquinone-9 3-methyltransferase